jgi:phage anti-repressor protein/phage antirepressor YoqD-like protein
MENNHSGRDLIQLHQTTIGRTQVPTVSARQLHSFLEVGKDFSNWVKDRIDAFGFVEGQDFVIVEGLISPNLATSKSRARTTKEYHLTIDMAKELSMVERNEKGKQARRYFIECEKRMMENTAAPMTREQLLARAVLESQEIIAEKDEVIHQLTEANVELKLDKAVLDRISNAKGAVSLTVAAKIIGKPPHKTIAAMDEAGWIYKKRRDQVGWTSNQRLINQGILEQKIFMVPTRYGSEMARTQAMVTPKGIVQLAKLMGVNLPPDNNQGRFLL